MSYEAPKKRAEPYTKIVEELPQMRRETVHLVRQAVSEGRRAYVLVNNRSEGNASLTIQVFSDRLRDAPRLLSRPFASYPGRAGKPNAICGRAASKRGQTSYLPALSPA